MRYHYNLKNLPFNFNPFSIKGVVCRKDVMVESPIQYDLLKSHNPEFISWLEDENLSISYIRYFESTPYIQYDLHRDSQQSVNEDLSNITKFNFIFISYDAEMRWYRTKPGKDGYVYKNFVKEPIMGFLKDDCDVVYTTQANNHCMINGGVIHDLQNGKNNNVNRRCYSIMFNIPWNTAVERFSQYLH